MSESKTTHEMGFQEHGNRVLQVFTEAKEDVNCNYNTMESDLDIDSLESSSSTEMIEEDVSSSSSSSPCSPLFQLSDLMAHLPIKRGISKFYKGRSESFVSLTSVKSVEDLAKKDKYWCRSRRSMKRYGQSQRLSPKGTIGKNKKGSSSTINKNSAFSSLGNISSLMAT